MKMTKPGLDKHGIVMVLWAALRASTVWGPLVTAAEPNHVDVLRTGLQALMVTLWFVIGGSRSRYHVICSPLVRSW